MIIYQKKNVNNWIKNGVKRKKGCGKKKILLPLRIKVGNFLQKEKAKGIKYNKLEIKEIVKKMGIKLIETGEISEEEFKKFIISDSWIKKLVKEFEI